MLNKDDGAGSLLNTLLIHTQSNGKIPLLVNAVHSIYNPNFLHISIETAKIYGFTKEQIIRIQNWYVHQRMKYSYGKIDPNEAWLLSVNWKNEVNERQSLREWNLNPDTQALLNKIHNDKHFGFKNLVEVISRSVIEERLIKTNVFHSVKILLASDIDDVLSGVDFIAECVDKNGKMHIIGIDLAVTDNYEYLEAKQENDTCSPKEYLARTGNGKKYNINGIPRVVQRITPESMSGVLGGFVDLLVDGKGMTTNTLSALYSRTSGKVDDLQFGTSALVQKTLKL